MAYTRNRMEALYKTRWERCIRRDGAAITHIATVRVAIKS
jgi:hypothetical protein